MIEVPPYILHNDISKAKKISMYAVRYFLSLNDFHNYWIEPKVLWSFFNDSFINQIHHNMKTQLPRKYEFTEKISMSTALGGTKTIEEWNHKSFPDTVVENKQILENYLSLLDKYKIKPILYLPPMVKEYEERFNRKILNELFAYLNELIKLHEFVFINSWAMNSFNDYDFQNLTHMNINGTKKFTQILKDVIIKLEGKN